MGGYTPKTAVSRIRVTQRESHLAPRDTSNHEDRDVQCCNRLGCSTRLNCMKSSPAGTSDRAKYSKPSFCSTSGKSMTGSSSKTYSFMPNGSKHQKEPQNSSSRKETISSKSRNIQVQTQVSDSILSTGKNQTGLCEPDNVVSGVLKDASVNIPGEVEGCSGILNRKARTRFDERSGRGSQNTSFGSPTLSSGLNKVSQVASSASHGRGGVRKLGCTSTSDVLPSGSSCSHLSLSRRAGVVKKRSDGECTASGKIMSGSSIGRSSSTRGSLPSPRLPPSERPAAQQAFRRTTKKTLSRDEVASNSQTSSGDSRVSTRTLGRGNKTALTEPLTLMSRLSQSELSIRVAAPPTSPQLSSPIRQHSYRRPGVNNETVRNQLNDQIEDSTAHLFRSPSIEQDDVGHFNTDEIAEVLSALQRIEQDDELTYEQRLVLETNLFLDGLSFLDQHRDMRLDIDSMSYEELLDLEAKMGTVSTALTEEALSTCLKRSFYKSSHPDAKSKNCAEDDVKCSVCQEEYAEGDEVGKLGCDHGYHMTCIHQWLGQKNWCPICKAPAAPS